MLTPNLMGPHPVADALALDEKGIAVYLDPVAGARVRHLGHAQIDPGGLRPKSRIAKVADSVGTPGDEARQHGRAAVSLEATT